MYKEKMIHVLSSRLGISLENIVAVGNSCFDVPMLETVGLGIAFNPLDNCIQEKADIIIVEKDLQLLFRDLKIYL
jgi:phosphoserine phosphatase